MKKKLVVISVVLAIVLAITALIAFLPRTTIDRSVIEENAPKSVAVAKYLDGDIVLSEDDYTLIGESGELQLYYRKSDYTIKVKNTKTGYEWSSMVGDDEYIHNADKGKTENTESVRNKLKRLFEIGYSNYSAISGKTNLIEDSLTTVKLLKIENGIAIDASFDSYGIGVTVEFWVDEYGLNVRVPRDKIVESDKYGIMSLTVLPMFGATTDNVENSFVLVPDATGGIYDIKPISKRQNPLMIDLYFPRDFDLDDIQENNEQGVKNAIMPYFGVSRGAEGFVGYVIEGEMNSYITLNPSGAVYNLNRVEPSISYRKSYTYLDPAGDEITVTEKNISAGDFAVHYSFVSSNEGENVTYSSMANKLQDYLVKIGKLVRTESAEKEGVNVNLQMLMSTKAESMIAEFLKVMTSCSDIENMVNAMTDDAKDNLRIMLLGWQSSGYNIYPSSGKAARGIGDIEELSKFLTEQGIESYLVDDLVYATTESDKFSKQTDAVYNEAKIPVTNTNGDQYVRNAYKEYLKFVDKSIPYYQKNSVYGIGFDKLGWYVFDDHQKHVEMNRYEAVSVYNAMLNETKEAGMKTAVQRGNAYILSATDYIYDLPKTGSSYELIDREIPFYQLVVHGYIPYSMDTPGNMSVDYVVEKLNWIECGAEPTFLLTQEMSEEFKDSKVENAFSTELTNWMDDVTAIAKEFNDRLAFTGNSTMKEHIEVAENVYRVTYSNGNKIYVNYNQKQITVDDVTVKALDYTVVGANGSIVG